MKTIILTALASIVLSACSAGSGTAHKVNYQAPDYNSARNSGYVSSSASCYSDELLSLGNYPAEFRKVTCDSD